MAAGNCSISGTITATIENSTECVCNNGYTQDLNTGLCSCNTANGLTAIV